MSEEPQPPQRSFALSAEEGADLEQSLLESPDDLEMRTQLLIHYSRQSRASKEARQSQLRHILVVIRCHPGSDLAGSSLMLLPFGTKEALEEVKSLWLQQVTAYPESAPVLGHAAKFLMHAGPLDWPQAQEWLNRAERLDPTNFEWPEQLGRLTHLVSTIHEETQNKTTAHQALRHYERAYALTDVPERRVLLLEDLAQNALNAGEFTKAQEYALQLLQNAALVKEGVLRWNYGNALHWSHIVLGKVALQRGDREAAKAHLEEAGKTPGSPQLNSFGPDTSLAQQLLEQGEKEAVIAYLKACSEFWELGKDDLAAWHTTIRQGQTPDFSANCLD